MMDYLHLYCASAVMQCIIRVGSLTGTLIEVQSGLRVLVAIPSFSTLPLIIYPIPTQPSFESDCVRYTSRAVTTPDRPTAETSASSRHLLPGLHIRLTLAPNVSPFTITTIRNPSITRASAAIAPPSSLCYGRGVLSSRFGLP